MWNRITKKFWCFFTKYLNPLRDYLNFCTTHSKCSNKSDLERFIIYNILPQNSCYCIVEILFKFLLLAFKMNYIDTYYFIYYVFVKEYLSLNVTLCKSFDETRPSSYSYFGTYFNSTSILKSFLCSRICKKCLHSLDDYNLAL